jgi:hypothetical protein
MPKFGKIIFLTVFGVAMGFLEAAVVVYLRELYYPEGFAFPLKQMAIEELFIEYLREISTIVMLISVGVIAGKNFYERLSYFLFSFGVWDIFYYVWLKVLLSWPPSLLTWDILFLIPVVWVGPVLAPLICAATMIVIAGSILHLQNKGYPVKIKIFEWLILLIGAFIILVTFIWDYTEIIIKGSYISRLSSLANDPDFQNTIANYTPTSYKWHLFFIGEIFILVFLFFFCKRTKTSFLSP